VTRFAGAIPGWEAARIAPGCLLFWVRVRKMPETAFTRYDHEEQNNTTANTEFNIHRDRLRCGTKCYALPQPTSTPQAANPSWN
jgi:hypothetical protein